MKPSVEKPGVRVASTNEAMIFRAVAMKLAGIEAIPMPSSSGNVVEIDEI